MSESQTSKFQLSKSNLHSTDGSGQDEALVICVLKAPCSRSSQVIPESWPAHSLPGPVHQIHQEVLLWEPTTPICKGGARAKGVWGELCSCRPFHTQKESWRSLRWVVWSQGSSHTVIPLPGWFCCSETERELKEFEVSCVVAGQFTHGYTITRWPCCSETESWKSLRWVMWSQGSLHTAMPVWFCCSETESGRQKLEM